MIRIILFVYLVSEWDYIIELFLFEKIEEEFFFLIEKVIF